MDNEKKPSEDKSQMDKGSFIDDLELLLKKHFGSKKVKLKKPSKPKKVITFDSGRLYYTVLALSQLVYNQPIDIEVVGCSIDQSTIEYTLRPNQMNQISFLGQTPFPAENYFSTIYFKLEKIPRVIEP